MLRVNNYKLEPAAPVRILIPPSYIRVVGRVTPCTPWMSNRRAFGRSRRPNGAHGVTRPTHVAESGSGRVRVTKSGRWRPSWVLAGSFTHWKPGGPRHTTSRGKDPQGTTSNSAFFGTSGFKGSRLQRLPSAMGFLSGQGCKLDRERRSTIFQCRGRSGGAHGAAAGALDHFESGPSRITFHVSRSIFA
jgi:hypothetical protein